MTGKQVPSGHKTILVVDDELDILEFLQVILEEEGYAVLTSAICCCILSATFKDASKRLEIA